MPYIKRCKYFIEYILFVTVTCIIRLCGIDLSSKICGMIVRKIGPWLPVIKTMRKNLYIAYGDNDDAKNTIINSALDNFGRVIGELPHLYSMNIDALTKRVEVIGIENILALQNQSKPYLILTAHLANWELPIFVPEIVKSGLIVIYRRINNPFINKLLTKWRKARGVSMIEKGGDGSDLIKALKSKNAIAMLVDQKMNNGISVPFFGKQAMTAHAIARFSLQFNRPIVPLRVVRKNGAHFQIIISPPLDIHCGGSKKDTTYEIMCKINSLLETWIIEYPEQWFWMHNRWP